MAWCEEAWNSRQYNGGEIELVYIVGDTDNDTVAYATAAATVPTTYQTYYLRGADPEILRIGQTSWKVTYRFSLPDGDDQEQEQNGYTYEFDTSGATQHIQTSLEDVGKWPSTAPDIGGAINFVNGHAQGIDIQIPTYAWSERRQFPYGMISDGYRYNLSRLTGKVNRSPWRIYAKGEVLFKGARGQFSAADEKWDISFSFQVSENKSNLAIAGQTITKEGWHHLQTRWAEDDDSTSGRIKPKLLGIYTQRVLEYGDFGALGF